MGLTAFAKMPTSRAVREFLDRVLRKSKAFPRHLICDKGRQFWCLGFKRWCRRHEIKLRFGAVGRHGSIAVVERLIRTLKQNCAQRSLVSLQKRSFDQLCALSRTGSTNIGLIARSAVERQRDLRATVCRGSAAALRTAARVATWCRLCQTVGIGTEQPRCAALS